MTEPTVRTPAGSAKSLQLTPIWEEVIRNQRVPSDTTASEILREIRGRLRAGEWEVRQHALRVLADVLPVTGEPIESADLQAALVTNLGSPAPGVRKAAREALCQLLQIAHNSEIDILELLGGCNDENVTLGIIIAMPDLLKPFILQRNGGYVLSSHCLSTVLTYLVNKVSTPIYRDASLEALLKIRDLCGEARFQKCLQNISPDPKTLQLLELNLDDSGVDLKLPLHEDLKWQEGYQEDTTENKADVGWSDNSDVEPTSNSVTTYHNYDFFKSHGSSEEGGSDGSEDTYTKEPSPTAKIVLETEIQLSEQKALTMRILEQDSVETEEGVVFDGPDGSFVSADGSFVMAVIPSSDDEGPRRTPRRVRFGGEVVKLCTPDSDETDIRIEIGQESTGHVIERMVIDKSHKASQIPLPIAPATSLPHAPEGSPRIEKCTVLLNQKVLESATESATTIPWSTLQSQTELSASTSSSNSIEMPSSISPSLSSVAIEAPNSHMLDPLSSSTGSSEPSSPEIQSTIVSDDSQGLNAIPHNLIPATDAFLWEKLGLLDEENVNILKSNTDWKEEMKALDELKRNLQFEDSKKILEQSDSASVRALVCYLLDSCKPQTAENSFQLVGLILQSIPTATAQGCLEDLLVGVCRHVSGSSATIMATTEILRFLFSRFSPNDIMQVLLGDRCLHSTSSKMRENALIMVLQILMTYPSSMFSPSQLLEGSCRSLADSRRRVRHAALEAVAVLAQFIPTSDIISSASKYGDSRLLSGVSARLARRSLPSVSPTGLVLYALQIPSTRRLGRPVPPEGADVDWILSGTGSLSSGSAKNRSQNQFSSRWVADNNIVRKASRDNPWTAQKHRTEDVASWTLVPVSEQEEGAYGELEQNYLGATARPLYVKLAASDDALRSHRYAVHRVAEVSNGGAPIRVLTPSILRKSMDSKPSPWTDNRRREYDVTEQRRLERVVGRKVVEAPRTIFVTTAPIGNATTPPAAVVLPSIMDKARPAEPAPRPQIISSRALEQSRFVDIKPEIKQPDVSNFQESATPSAFPAVSSRSAGPISTARPPPVEIEQVIQLPLQSESPEKLFQRTRRESTRDSGIEARVSMASAPPAITSRERETSSSSSTSLSQPGPPNEDVVPLEVLNSISYQSLNDSYNQKVKAKRKPLALRGAPGSTVSSANHFPETLKPFDRPKEGLDTCFNQLDSQQWEVTMQGLTSLVRLVRHHPNTVVAHLHPLAAALSRQIRNLRSQVARAACQASGELFTTLKRHTEQELEEVTGALFHRTADTNRFIRADSNVALDAMVDSITPSRATVLILSKGTSHQNAVVRTTSARLLLRISEKLGPDKVLSFPKDIRNKMLQAGAGLLTEGRLETRSFAKQFFKVWSSHPNFSAIILEAIPTNTMRLIDKNLASLRY